jgi:CRP-like cAMP-binding protein
MAIDQVIACLSRVPVFTGLKPLQITEIGRRARRCAFSPGEAITMAGEPGDGAYLILSGEAACRVNPGGRGALEPVALGSLVGELAMFIEHTYGTSVVAQDWVDCLKLERFTLTEQMRQDPDIAERIAEVIRGRMAVVAAELQVIDQLLTDSIAHCNPAPCALPAPAREEAASIAA